MTIDIQTKATVIKGFDSNLDILSLKLEHAHLENQHLIIDLSTYKTLKTKDLNVFLPFAKKLKNNSQSFVIVVSDFDFNKASNKINIVPTMQEAFDIIEMEGIERDLGF